MSINPKELGMNVSKVKDMIASSRNKQATDTYELTVVTPMFGGGIEPGQVNEVHPVRASSIRGHLRFWWRATRGAACESASELRVREASIFGDTRKPSSVKLWVETVPHSAIPKHANHSQKMKNGKIKYLLDSSLRKYEYALFPFHNIETSVQYMPKYKFQLHIQYDAKDPSELEQLQLEVKAALWAWVNFGGIGARTRRGCGSLYSPCFSPDSGIRSIEDLQNWFAHSLREYQLALPATVREWPTLSDQIKINPGKKILEQAWEDVIRCYKEFRRKPNDPKKRSHWPEAVSIRRITGMAEPLHEASNTLSEKGHEVAFPRAQLGLPIIFKFKDNEQKQGPRPYEREPFATQLVPEHGERLASPLLLKAIAVSEKEGFSAVIVLNQPKITGLKLKKAKSNQALIRSIPQHEIYVSPNYDDPSKNPMKNASNQKTVFTTEAFLGSEEVRKWELLKQP